MLRPCGYQPEGIDAIQLLDFEDFEGFTFENDGSYDSCYVTEMRRRGRLAELDTPDGAKYTSTLQNGLYTHTVETFISDLNAAQAASLHLATKRRYVPIFRAKTGKYFAFAEDTGATVRYANQTAEGLGSLVTITAQSVYPLFELDPQAVHFWVLDTGRWDMSKRWWDFELWNWK